mmetsp:Transcript_12268/g.40084  ORF Transcript_12268/g.40084 Transcript_12268/m.40084 type:complete len:282 (-) Transcript_12268:108-953(-)
MFFTGGRALPFLVVVLVCPSSSLTTVRLPVEMGLMNRLRPKKEIAISPIKVGEKVPAVDVEDVGAAAVALTALEKSDDEEPMLPSVPVSTEDLFASGKAILFGLPGAFTPTCSDVHVPGFMELAPTFAEAGIDLIACTSENDRFVLNAWNASLASCVGKPNLSVKFLADADGELATKLGFREDMGFGVGVRTQRFALVCDDGVVTHVAVDPGMNVCEATSAYELLKVVAPDLVPQPSQAPNAALLAGAAIAFAAALAAYYYQTVGEGGPFVIPSSLLPTSL